MLSLIAWSMHLSGSPEFIRSYSKNNSWIIRGSFTIIRVLIILMHTIFCFITHIFRLNCSVCNEKALLLQSLDPRRVIRRLMP